MNPRTTERVAAMSIRHSEGSAKVIVWAGNQKRIIVFGMRLNHISLSIFFENSTRGWGFLRSIEKLNHSWVSIIVQPKQPITFIQSDLENGIQSGFSKFGQSPLETILSTPSEKRGNMAVNQIPKTPQTKKRATNILKESNFQSPLVSLFFKYSPKVARRETLRKPIKYGWDFVSALNSTGKNKMATSRSPRK